MPAEANWAGNLTYRAAAVHHPATVAQVQDLVARLPRVRALGTRHSFSAVADRPGGDLVSLAALPSEITVDAAAMTVSVTGGTRYGELAAALHSQGFALHNTGSLPHISVAGATATGTHGSGDANGILATAVVALEVVGADGTLQTVDRAHPALAAMAVGLGMFGVITRVVLEIQPTYRVRQDVYVGAPWDGVLEAFDEIMAGAYSVSLMGDPGAPVLGQIWQKTRVGDEPPVPAPRSLHGGALVRRRRRARRDRPQPACGRRRAVVGAASALPARRAAVGGRRRAADRVLRRPPARRGRPACGAGDG